MQQPDKATSPLQVKVWGDFACFTRPELKAERVSYPMMTPTAAGGILSAIFWKPEFAWVVEEIWLLNPIRYFSVSRNEINARQSARVAQKWAAEGGGFDASAHRVQRHTLGLRDAAYVIRARQVLSDQVDSRPAKYRDQFRRRVTAGRCFAQPYLGCREFSAYFADPGPGDVPQDIDADLGSMLLHMDYALDGMGQATPQFWGAELRGGVLKVPQVPQVPQVVPAIGREW